MSIRPDEVTPFVLPVNSTVYAYVFTDKEANVILDDVPMTIGPDEPFIISSSGLHTIYSNKNLILLLLHYPLIPEGQGINGFGVTIPCAETVNIKPIITLSPFSGKETYFPENCMMIILTILIVIAIIRVLKGKIRTEN